MSHMRAVLQESGKTLTNLNTVAMHNENVVTCYNTMLREAQHVCCITMRQGLQPAMLSSPAARLGSCLAGTRLQQRSGAPRAGLQ